MKKINLSPQVLKSFYKVLKSYNPHVYVELALNPSQSVGINLITLCINVIYVLFKLDKVALNNFVEWNDETEWL